MHTLPHSIHVHDWCCCCWGGCWFGCVKGGECGWGWFVKEMSLICFGDGNGWVNASLLGDVYVVKRAL